MAYKAYICLYFCHFDSPKGYVLHPSASLLLFCVINDKVVMTYIQELYVMLKANLERAMKMIFDSSTSCKNKEGINCCYSINIDR